MRQVPHFSKPWQIFVSVCLKRMNVISRPLNEIEQQYAKLQHLLEIEKSVLNDYEYRKASLEKVLLSKKQSKGNEDDKVLEAKNQLLAMQEEEENWAKDAQNIRLAQLDQFDNDYCSLKRKLSDILHYVVEDDQVLKEKVLLYPYTTIQPNECLRSASERLLASHGLPSCRFLSNSPVGHVKIRYDKNESRGETYQGAKMFFMMAFLKDTHAKPSTLHKWLIPSELPLNLNKEYYKKVNSFLI
ncbi:large ribosomal subunit protein mL46 isoform X2 [Hydra vulgaris]|uniref:Large ribosomal subunit protein mL46 isoform X2 n=1 Tax=Hydra vulgaris TaxID=6087 RepID=A0ABM4DIE3_HYDVU